MRQMGIKAQWIKQYIQTTIDSDFSESLKNILNEAIQENNDELYEEIWDFYIQNKHDNSQEKLKLKPIISDFEVFVNLVNGNLDQIPNGNRILDYDEVKNIQMLAAEVQTVREELELEVLERYSNRLHGKMDFSGLIGELEYAGELTPFVPWLATAEVLHIGRNTTFGMGNIQVYFI